MLKSVISCGIIKQKGVFMNSQNKEHSIGKEIGISLIIEIVVSAILGLVTFIWNCVSVYQHVLYQLVIVLFFGQLVLVITYLIWRNFSFKSYHYPMRKIKHKYHFVESTIKYQLVRKKGESTNKLLLSKRILVCSDSETLDKIDDKFLWTGKVIPQTPTGKKSISEIHLAKDKVGVWKYLDVHFNRRIQRNQTIELEYSWPPILDCKSSSPFISVNTDIPTKQITFELDLGKEYAFVPVYLEERRSIDGDDMLSNHNYALDENGKIVIKISPRRFRYYILFWKW